jgi:hypothetical protein
MGSRTPAIAAVTLAVLVAGGALAVAGGSDRSRTTRLTAQIETQKLTVVDTGPTGSSPGDLVLEQDNLTRDGRRVGTAQVTCSAHTGSLVNGSAQCSGTFYLRQGRLQTQGDARSVNGSVSGAGAITGGTGRYLGVRGSYGFETTEGTTRLIRFRLVR